MKWEQTGEEEVEVKVKRTRKYTTNVGRGTRIDLEIIKSENPEHKSCHFVVSGGIFSGDPHIDRMYLKEGEDCFSRIENLCLEERQKRVVRLKEALGEAKERVEYLKERLGNER